ncbi:hypothetical protein [Anaerosporobacter faecicola]|uniref:hypothetical protein n=1 Tax=Anaerosporobacter faecicola TaxID=2718714 RepID=UPI00143B72E7|nr:hypothetical protein [Anaerosporobacter faecicola]
MALLPGVYQATKKDGTIYYRTSFTYRNKHISLGSYAVQEDSNAAYQEALLITQDCSITLDSYIHRTHYLSFDKWVTLINFRDHGLYFKNPIYLKDRYFFYYLDHKTVLKFDVDDLFYYSKHKIMRRGNHLFVADFGMQISILSRYGIHSFSVPGKDYRFANGDSTDFRYGNIQIMNRYIGVRREQVRGSYQYVAKIHLIGDFIVGRYATETEAAVAYNKAVNFLWEHGVKKNYSTNYIEELDEIAYAALYNKLRISNNLRKYISEWERNRNDSSKSTVIP